MKTSDNIVRIFSSQSLPAKKISSFLLKRFDHPCFRESEIPWTASGQILHAGLRHRTTSLKLLQLAKTSRGYEIAKIGFSPLDRNAKRLYELKIPLEKLIKENKLKGEVVSVLPLSMMQTYSFFYLICPIPKSNRP